MTWKTPHGNPDWLKVNESGDVKFMSRAVTFKDGRVRTWPEIRPKIKVNADGYLYVGLNIEGKKQNRLVHRLVMLAFEYREDAEDLDVNHDDGVRSNCRLSNLGWMTRAENNLHAFRVLKRSHPRQALGKIGRAQAIAVVGTPIGGGDPVRFLSQLDAQRHGFKQASISACLLGKLKTHKGYTWAADTKNGVSNAAT